MATSISNIKCGELFWKLDASRLEYLCLLCVEPFSVHSEYLDHLQQCLCMWGEKGANVAEPDFEVKQEPLFCDEEAEAIPSEDPLLQTCKYFVMFINMNLLAE